VDESVTSERLGGRISRIVCWEVRDVRELAGIGGIHRRNVGGTPLAG
jgi:hypothetical protein